MRDFKTFLAECLQTLPDNLKHLKSDIAAHFEYKLTEELRAKNIMMRDEFDILNKLVLSLEQRISELEVKINGEKD